MELMIWRYFLRDVCLAFFRHMKVFTMEDAEFLGKLSFLSLFFLSYQHHEREKKRGWYRPFVFAIK